MAGVSNRLGERILIGPMVCSFTSLRETGFQNGSCVHLSSVGEESESGKNRERERWRRRERARSQIIYIELKEKRLTSRHLQTLERAGDTWYAHVAD